MQWGLYKETKGRYNYVLPSFAMQSSLLGQHFNVQKKTKKTKRTAFQVRNVCVYTGPQPISVTPYPPPIAFFSFCEDHLMTGHNLNNTNRVSGREGGNT